MKTFALVFVAVVVRCVLASLYEGPSVRRSVGPSVRDAFVKNSFFRDFWALLPLPTGTRLMAVYPALLL